MNALNSGCGSSGFDLNSGWNWQPRNQGWSREFADLDVRAVGRLAGDPQAAAFSTLFVFAIEFVAMAMALADLARAVGLVREAALGQLAGPSAQPHRAAQFVDALQLAQLVRSRGAACPDRTRWSRRRSRPQTLRANSITSVCMPRQIPKYGTLRSRA